MEGSEQQHQLLLARVIAILENGTGPLRVAKLSDFSITKYKATNIARFCPLAAPGNEDAQNQEIPQLPFTSQVHRVGVCHSAAALLGIDTSAMDQSLREALEKCHNSTNKLTMALKWSWIRLK